MHRIFAAACLALACLLSPGTAAHAQSCAQLRAEHDALVQRLISGTDYGSAMALTSRIQQLQAILPGCRDTQAPPVQQPQQPQVGDYCSNGTTCPVGTRCALNGHHACVAQGRDDCGNGTSCPAGSLCSRNGRMCLTGNTVDCGSYTCSDGNRCARDGKSCLAAREVDCGGFHCSAGMKCGTGNRCLAQGEVDCGGGKSCRAGTVCLKGGAECLTLDQLAKRVADEKNQKEDEKRAEQDKMRHAKEDAARKIAAQKDAARLKDEERRQDIQRQKDLAKAKADQIVAEKAAAQKAKADRVAADKANAAWRTAAAKAAAQRIAAARAAGAARIQETRRNIDAVRVTNASRALAYWNAARMRAVRPLPLPELPVDPFRDLPVVPPPASPAPRGQDPDYGGGGPAGSEITETVPLKWVGKLFFLAPKGEGVCSGQFIAPNVVLTAAHCVRDNATGKFYGNIIFALQFHNGHASQRYNGACVATPDGWVRATQDRYRWDYALILTEQVSTTGHFGWQVAWNGAHNRAHKVGYPADITSGQIVQVDQGSLTVRGPIVEMRHANPLHKEGSSGGAWVGRYSASQGATENIALSVSSYILTGLPGIA